MARPQYRIDDDDNKNIKYNMDFDGKCWQCSACTIENWGNATECAYCHALPVRTWICSNCSLSNNECDTHCSDCQTPLSVRKWANWKDLDLDSNDIYETELVVFGFIKKMQCLLPINVIPDLVDRIVIVYCYIPAPPPLRRRSTFELINAAVEASLSVLSHNDEINALSSEEKGYLFSFMDFTDAEPLDALQYLRQSNWNANNALNDYFVDHPDHNTSLDSDNQLFLEINNDDDDDDGDDMIERINTDQQIFDLELDKYRKEIAQLKEELMREKDKNEPLIFGNNEESKSNNDNDANFELCTESMDQISQSMIDFSDKYLSHDVNSMFDSNIYNHSSDINKKVSQFETEIGLFHLKTKEFAKHLYEIGNPNPNKYKEWKRVQIMKWITNLENARFEKYSSNLQAGFEKKQVDSGELLLGFEMLDLKGDPFNISNFKDRMDIIKHFQSLSTEQI